MCVCVVFSKHPYLFRNQTNLGSVLSCLHIGFHLREIKGFGTAMHVTRIITAVYPQHIYDEVSGWHI